ncbi:MAG TPA: alpha-amylase family glycosyl hydrolase [Gemmatimonadaceae bacterium]|nr:alpha-amylase family glycosyl hydrolase [Gemmatimonadaceae bacterium]
MFFSRFDHRTLVAAAVTLALSASCTGTPKTPRPPAPVVAGPWWQEGVCYEVFVRSFYDSDGDGIGDLKGLTARLDYINDGNPASTKSLGANCIWLMPIDKATSYHGYDVIDYYHVDPMYGSDEDFRTLVAEAHRRGIHVIVDFVPNHSSSENPWFQSALRGPGSPYRDWYRWSSTAPSEKGPWGQEVWHKSPVRDEFYYGLFWHGMPDLNYETPALMQEMLKVTRYWLTEMHADGFRFDAIPYLVEEHDRIQHTEGTHEVLRNFGKTIRATSPSSFTVGEMSDEDPRILATYYPDQLDAYFAFGVAFATVDAARTGKATRFIEAVSDANRLLPAGRWSPFLTNHDHVRVMSQLGGDVARERVAAGAMLMLPGMPFVYYGEEIGMLGTKPDETIRNPMQWSPAPNGGFTTGSPWEALQPDWRTKNVAVQDDDSTSLLNHYRRLIHLRNSHQALRTGSLTMLATGDTTGTIAAWLRESGREAFLIVVNFGDRKTQVWLPSLRRIVRTPSDRTEQTFMDPPRACGRIVMMSDGSFDMVSTIAARSVCVFRLPLY